MKKLFSKKKEEDVFDKNNTYDVMWWDDAFSGRSVKSFGNYDDAFNYYNELRCKGTYAVRLCHVVDEYMKNIY